MKITENIFIIGSGNFGLSHETDCNVYLIGSGDQFAIIDCGSGICSDIIINNVLNEGIKKEWIKYLILTHSHWDHAGGCHAIAKAFNCKICAHKMAFAKLNEYKNAELSAVVDEQKRDIPNDIEISGSTEINLNDVTLRFMYTPGHSPDSISVYGLFGCGISLFCGDTAAACGKIGVISNKTNLEQYTESIKTLYELNSNALFPGHGIFTLKNSTIHLQLTYEKMKSSWYEVFPTPTPFNPSWWNNYYSKLTKI